MPDTQVPSRRNLPPHKYTECLRVCALTRFLSQYLFEGLLVVTHCARDAQSRDRSTGQHTRGIRQVNQAIQFRVVWGLREEWVVCSLSLIYICCPCASTGKESACSVGDLHIHTHTHTHTHTLGRFSKGQEGTEMGLGQDSYLKE